MLKCRQPRAEDAMPLSLAIRCSALVMASIRWTHSPFAYGAAAHSSAPGAASPAA